MAPKTAGDGPVFPFFLYNPARLCHNFNKTFRRTGQTVWAARREGIQA